MEDKHPLMVLAERTKDIKNFSKQGCENAKLCLLTYLRMKPSISTNFFTALQSLPQWLEDKGKPFWYYSIFHNIQNNI